MGCMDTNRMFGWASMSTVSLRSARYNLKDYLHRTIASAIFLVASDGLYIVQHHQPNRVWMGLKIFRVPSQWKILNSNSTLQSANFSDPQPTYSFLLQKYLRQKISSKNFSRVTFLHQKWQPILWCCILFYITNPRAVFNFCIRFQNSRLKNFNKDWEWNAALFSEIFMLQLEWNVE